MSPRFPLSTSGPRIVQHEPPFQHDITQHDATRGRDLSVKEVGSMVREKYAYHRAYQAQSELRYSLLMIVPMRIAAQWVLIYE